MMGWIPAPDRVTENSSAENIALVSVTAMAGISFALHRSGSFFSRSAPSSKEYSVWVRR